MSTAVVLDGEVVDTCCAVPAVFGDVVPCTWRGTRAFTTGLVCIRSATTSKVRVVVSTTTQSSSCTEVEILSSRAAGIGLVLVVALATSPQGMQACCRTMCSVVAKTPLALSFAELAACMTQNRRPLLSMSIRQYDACSHSDLRWAVQTWDTAFLDFVIDRVASGYMFYFGDPNNGIPRRATAKEGYQRWVIALLLGCSDIGIIAALPVVLPHALLWSDAYHTQCDIDQLVAMCSAGRRELKYNNEMDTHTAAIASRSNLLFREQAFEAIVATNHQINFPERFADWDFICCVWATGSADAPAQLMHRMAALHTNGFQRYTEMPPCAATAWVRTGCIVHCVLLKWLFDAEHAGPEAITACSMAGLGFRRLCSTPIIVTMPAHVTRAILQAHGVEVTRVRLSSVFDILCHSHDGTGAAAHAYEATKAALLPRSVLVETQLRSALSSVRATSRYKGTAVEFDTGFDSGISVSPMTRITNMFDPGAWDTRFVVMACRLRLQHTLAEHTHMPIELWLYVLELASYGVGVHAGTVRYNV